MHITEPIAIILVIAKESLLPVNLKNKEVIRRVAMLIPETGLLLLPTSPTILDDTVAKKKPNKTMRSAPENGTGIVGESHIISVIINIEVITVFIPISLDVRLLSLFVNFKFLTEEEKVSTIRGRDFIKLMIPPQARAPAPI